MTFLDVHVAQLNRVGKTVSSRLAILGIHTLQDLLFSFPFRYEDYSRVFHIGELAPGVTGSVEGNIIDITTRRAFRTVRTITQAYVTDDTGTVGAVWFNQPFLSETLKVGHRISLSGKVESRGNELVFSNPSYERLTSGVARINTACITPVYPLTANITQKQLRFLISQALLKVDDIAEWLPVEIKDEEKLMDGMTALREIHFPSSYKTLREAQRRLKFEEIFLLQLYNEISRKDVKQHHAFSVSFESRFMREMVSCLPFELTNSQKKAVWQVVQDMERDTPMNRLLQGDVGSGKTVVCALVVANVARAGYQAAIMAPTEILARQHYETFCKLLSQLPLRIALLSREQAEMKGDGKTEEGRLSQRKKTVLKSLEDHTVDVVIGTHALLSNNVNFARLAFIMVDEQHRFGVLQRKALREKMASRSMHPHMLSMTATPIPRTLALTLYGDLNISVIREMPKGRRPIQTRVVSSHERASIYHFINKEICSGRQCYVICPLISESDTLGITSVEEEHKRLTRSVFRDMPIGLLHGKLPAREKEKIMDAFVRNEIKILVTTSVVEVGVDVANATCMLIEGGERFGLAQLHQFRGRVGRSDLQSYCFVMAGGSLQSRKRLHIFASCNDGFELASKDLEFRGPGEMFGNEQSGFTEFKIASLVDTEIIDQASMWARKLVETDVNLSAYPLLSEKVQKKLAEVHLE